MNLTISGIEYSFASAPKFIQYGTKLLAEVWGSNMDLAPRWALHRANLWAVKYGVVV